MGARALLAFRALDRDESGSYTEDCELGAELELEFQQAVVNVDRYLGAYFTALAKKNPQHG